jgi:hypothetical protein
MIDPFMYHRGAFTGGVTKMIIEEADKIGLPISGSGRKIRLALASELVEREVKSFKDLTDQELWDINRWVVSHRRETREWLAETYGYQESMF